MENKKRTIIISVIVIALIVLTIGATYAFFTANVDGNESTSTLLATGGTLEIWYENQSGTIELYNIYPKEEAWVRKTFTLTGKNTTDMQMKYTIGLKVDSNTFTSGALSYSLISENTSNNGEIVSPKQNIPITKDLHYFGIGHFLTGENLVHTYTLEIFYKDNGQNQNANQGASFTGHIIILDREIPTVQIALSADNLALIGYTNGEVPNNLVILSIYTADDNNNYQVTSIADNAFGELINNKYTPLPSISNLTNLTLNEGLESIGQNAFWNATNLTGNLTMPSTLKTIGNNAFNSTSITSLTLNEGLEKIETQSFYNIKTLTSHLTMPSTLKSLGWGSFMNSSITGLTLNEGLESIGSQAFYNTKDLTGHLILPGTVKTMGGAIFEGSNISKLTLKEGLKNLGNSAFSNTANLNTDIILPSTMKSIGGSAFNSSAITNIALNEGLESIGQAAFHNTFNLKSSIIMPSTLKSIGSSAFSGSAITDITLNEGLDRIEISAFGGTTNLTNIVMPSTIKSIGVQAFNGSGIKSIILNEGLEIIDNLAFENATNLKAITIPLTVNYIGYLPFSGTSLTTINYRGTQEQWNQIELYDSDSIPSGVTINYNYTGE